MKNENPIIAMISQAFGVGNAVVLSLSNILTLFQQAAQYGNWVIGIAIFSLCLIAASAIFKEGSKKKNRNSAFYNWISSAIVNTITIIVVLHTLGMI